MKKISTKKLLLIALVITLLTALIHGEWSTGYIGGVGRGWPWHFWRATTYTDVMGFIGESDKQYANINGGLAFIADIVFWFCIMLGGREIIRKIK